MRQNDSLNLFNQDRLVKFFKKEETIALKSEELHLKKKQPLHFKKAQRKAEQDNRKIKAWYEISPNN